MIHQHTHAENAQIEQLRCTLKKNHAQIQVKDLGAGSKKNNSNSRKISTIVASAAMPKKQGQLISRLVQSYELKNILELGTSLGIGTAYLTGNQSDIRVTTIEGCPTIAAYAKKHFEQLDLQNVVVKVGDFEHVWEALELQNFDLIYIDGNHRKEPTLRYFERALDQISAKGFIVVDDIYWSREMKAAWEEMKSNPQLNVSMDFFRFGILTRWPGESKQNFIL